MNLFDSEDLRHLRKAGWTVVVIAAILGAMWAMGEKGTDVTHYVECERVFDHMSLGYVTVCDSYMVDRPPVRP